MNYLSRYIITVVATVLVAASFNVTAVDVLLEELLHNNVHDSHAHQHTHHGGHSESHHHHGGEEEHSHHFECCKYYAAATRIVSEDSRELITVSFSPFLWCLNRLISTYRVTTPGFSTGPPNIQLVRLQSSYSRIPTGPPATLFS